VDHAVILKYEDDAPVIRIPDPSLTFHDGSFVFKYDRTTILVPIDSLCCPWHPVKTGTAFRDFIVFLGLLWDLPHRRVSLPEDKRQKYLTRVRDMLTTMRANLAFSLLTLQELHGALCHLCFVYREGRSRVAVFSNAMSGFKGNSLARRHLSNTALKTLLWWERKLDDASFFRQLAPIGTLRDLGIYVDASTSWGIGIIIGSSWYAIPLKADWKSLLPGHDICWLEAVAIELLFMFLDQLDIHDMHLLVRSDNKGAIGAHTKGRSPNVGINLCVRRTYAISAGLSITPKIVYVPTDDNLADAPSRGESAPHTHQRDRLARSFQLPAELALVFVDELLVTV
jgi:hypothetical protein